MSDFREYTLIFNDKYAALFQQKKTVIVSDSSRHAVLEFLQRFGYNIVDVSWCHPNHSHSDRWDVCVTYSVPVPEEKSRTGIAHHWQLYTVHLK